MLARLAVPDLHRSERAGERSSLLAMPRHVRLVSSYTRIGGVAAGTGVALYAPRTDLKQSFCITPSVRV